MTKHNLCVCLVPVFVIITFFWNSLLRSVSLFTKYGNNDFHTIQATNKIHSQVVHSDVSMNQTVEEFPYITKEELIRNASIVRFDYYQNLSYPFKKYEMNMDLCDKTQNKMLSALSQIQKWSFLRVNTSKHQLSWKEFRDHREHSPRREYMNAKYGWMYGENICVNNNTRDLHIYVTDYEHFLTINKTAGGSYIPGDRANYQHALKINIHYGKIPSQYKVLDNFYLIINRGWNNMYHHSEWIIQFIRYLLFNEFIPPMETVVSFPDNDWVNHRLHDSKGHYRYAMGYLDLALDSFKADLQGEDKTPRFFEGKEYRAEGGIVCGKQAIVVPIISDMIKCFIDNKEAYQMRMLAYKRFKAPLPLTPPKKLYLLFVDRATANRGIKNQEEILGTLKNSSETEFHHQVNQKMSFSEQVISMFPVDILFTVHGAGLTNVIFMLPGSALIEVFPPLFLERYYMYSSRRADIIYKRITETKIVNKSDYWNAQKKIDYTNKVFRLPSIYVEEALQNVTKRVWEKKYSFVPC